MEAEQQGANLAPSPAATPAFATEADRSAYLSTLAFTEREIVTKLTRGWKAVDIAKTMGLDGSYISQVANRPENIAFINAVGRQQSEENEAHDRKLDQGESILLDRINARAAMQSFRDQVAAFKVLNSAKRRRDTVGAPVESSTPVVVELHIPANLLTNYVRNASSEIVEVEGRTMISARAADLPALMQEKLGRLPPAQKQELATSDQVHRAEATLATPQRRRRIPIEKMDISDII